MDSAKRPELTDHVGLSDRWVGAGDLKVGDTLKQADGTIGTVTGVQTVVQAKQMYNLSVGVAHTYFVGEMGWLVHNCEPWAKANNSQPLTFITPQKGLSGTSPFRETPFVFTGSRSGDISITHHSLVTGRKRGWSLDKIKDTIDNPSSTRSTMDTRSKIDGTRESGAATIYYGADGSAVILNDLAREVIS